MVEKRDNGSALRILGSREASAVISIAGLLIPLLAWLEKSTASAQIAIACLAVLVLLQAARFEWSKRRELRFQRPVVSEMSDPGFFEKISSEIERQLRERADDLVDGYLRPLAGEIPVTYQLLYRTLTEDNGASKRVLATDLTKNPELLLTRREYLAANRRLIESGGSVDRVFICTLDDLATESFSRDILSLIEKHRSIGVNVGLAVRDFLPAILALDYVVFGNAAAIVEEEQANSEYTTGRSTLYFKRVDKWARLFGDLWRPNETPAATALLGTYAAAASVMHQNGNWDPTQCLIVLQGAYDAVSTPPSPRDLPSPGIRRGS